MLQWMLLALMPIYLVTGCGDLEPEMQDTRTVILNMDFDQRSSSRTSRAELINVDPYQTHINVDPYQTHLIMVMTSENIEMTPGEKLSNSNYWDYKVNNRIEYVLYDSDREITLNMKLNTKMKIFAFLFRENYSIGGDPDYDLFFANRDAGYYGESQIITIDDRSRIPANIILNQVPGTGIDTAGGTDTGGGTDYMAPTVMFSPANGATGVTISNNIAITFSEAVRNIDNTVLTDSNSGDANGVGSLITLRLNNTYGTNIAFYATIDTNKKVITIDPTNNLPHSQEVYVAIGATVEDSAGNPITAANATFTTMQETTGPTVSAVYPADNQNEVSITENISVTFSKAMNTTSVTTNISNTTCSGSFQLSYNNFDSCIQMSSSPLSSNSYRTFTVDPSSNLSHSTNYKIRVTTGVKDTAGNSLSSQYEISNGFTTAFP